MNSTTLSTQPQPDDHLDKPNPRQTTGWTPARKGRRRAQHWIVEKTSAGCGRFSARTVSDPPTTINGMSTSEVLATRDDVIAALSRLHAAEATAGGQTLIDGLKFDQLIGRRLRYHTAGKVARLDRDGEFTARRVHPAPAVADLMRIHPREARRLVAMAAAVFPTTLHGQPLEPTLPATAAALAAGDIDTTHAEIIEHALTTDAARRIDPPRWCTAEAQLAEWARTCRPDELARMATELIQPTRPRRPRTRRQRTGQRAVPDQIP
jgi:uncharacterized membrane protein